MNKSPGIEEKLITQGQLDKELEQITGVEIQAIPDASSSVRELGNLDKPDYWQLFLLSQKSNESHYIGTLHNVNYDVYHSLDSEGIIHTNITVRYLYANIETENRDLCNVPQNEIDMVIPALRKLVGDNVFEMVGDIKVKSLQM